MTDRSRVHLFEQREDGAEWGKTFHYVLGGGTVRRGRERTMCDRVTGSMRKAAPFKPGDARGAVHLKYACPSCVEALNAHVTVWGL